MKKGKIFILAVACGGLCICLLLIGWMRRKQPATWDKIAVSIETGAGEATIKLWHNYYDNKEYLFLPSFWEEDDGGRITGVYGKKVSWDGDLLPRSGELTTLLKGEHSLQVGDNSFQVVVLHSGTVPALFLTTQSGSLTHIEEKKGNGEPGWYRMVNADGSLLSEGSIKKLKSRGNATFLEDKKPYQMTLEDSADLLGSGNKKKYILLANRQDQSLLRDRIMYDMAADMGLPYSPVSRFVDLYVNEEYRGSYQLSEKVETGAGGIAINTDTRDIKTGFLVTLEYNTEDRLAEAEYRFQTTNGQNVVVKRPKQPTAAQLAYIEQCFQSAEDGIRSGTFPQGQLDVTSFARKYLIEEIGKNLDAMYTSQYFYQDAGEGQLLYAGPVWDYDKTLGNPLIEHTRPVDFQAPQGIYAAAKQEDASWWYDLWQIPAFRERAIEEFAKTAVPAIDGMLETKIDAYRDEVWESAAMDYMRWDPFEDFKYGNELAFEQEYQAEIDGIKEFLTKRKAFLTDIWLEGRAYDRIPLDAGEGTIYVQNIDAVEGRTLAEPRDPKLEGYRFAGWIREDTGEPYDFTQPYDGIPFTLRAVYSEEE